MPPLASHAWRRRILSVAAAACLAVACGDEAEPVPPLHGTWVLSAVDDKRLPGLVYTGLDTDPGDGEYRILAVTDRLYLADDGGYTRNSEFIVVYPARADTFAHDGYIEGEYSVSGDSIRFVVLGSLQAVGRRRGADLEVTEMLFGPPSSRLRYRRLP